MLRRVRLVLCLILAVEPSAGLVISKSRLNVGVLLPVAPNKFAFSPPALKALQLAVKHINEHPTILPEHELVLTFNDTQVCCEDVPVRLQLCETVDFRSATLDLRSTSCSSCWRQTMRQK